MRSLEELTEEAQKANLRLRVNPERLNEIARLSDEGLFHVPILALCILLSSEQERHRLQLLTLRCGQPQRSVDISPAYVAYEPKWNGQFRTEGAVRMLLYF